MSATTHSVSVGQGSSLAKSPHPQLPAPHAPPQQQLQQAGQRSPLARVDHPSFLPLLFEGHTLSVGTGAAAVPLIEGAYSRLRPNQRASLDRELVLGFASEEGNASCHTIVLGQLRFRRFLACARNKLWWMTPEWGSAARQLPPETQFLLLELEGAAAGGDGTPVYALLLPLIDGTFRATLRPARGQLRSQR